MKKNESNVTIQNDNSKKVAFGLRAKFLVILILAALIAAGVIAASFLWQNKAPVQEEDREVAAVKGAELTSFRNSDEVSPAAIIK